MKNSRPQVSNFAEYTHAKSATYATTIIRTHKRERAKACPAPSEKRLRQSHKDHAVPQIPPECKTAQIHSDRRSSTPIDGADRHASAAVDALHRINIELRNLLEAGTADPANAESLFQPALPGQVGVRNFVRGDGYFGIDLGLSKRWNMPLE
jgi:hypothetical protein